jgi:hypothetical protein
MGTAIQLAPMVVDGMAFRGSSAEARMAPAAGPRLMMRSTAAGGNMGRSLAGNVTGPKTMAELGADESLVPGMSGVQVLSGKIPGTKGGKEGISFEQMWDLSTRDGVEYLLTRRVNPAGEGEFWLYSGRPDAVYPPIGERPIAHTHPITDFPVNPLHHRFPSPEDITVLNDYWNRAGGAEPTSRILWGNGPRDFTFFSPSSRPNAYNPQLPSGYRGPQGRVEPND